MRRLVLPIILFAAVPAAAASQEEPPQPPELVQAGEAWGQCLSTGVENADRNQAPRAAARAILAGCQALQTSLVAAHRRWVEGSSLGEREKREALAAMRNSLTGIEEQLATAIRQSRADD